MSQKEPSVLYEALQRECVDNRLYFEDDKDEKSQKLYRGFIRLEEQVLNLLPLLDEVRKVAPNYDFKNVPANGYRSFLKAADKFSSLSLKICENIRGSRSSLFFQKARFMKWVFF